jgi:hypothetical protein
MKKLLLFFLFSFISLSFVAQNYKLLPDSCTYCFYTSYIYQGWQNTYYEVSNVPDTIISGNQYHSVKNQTFQDYAYVRQFGDELYGLIPDSTMSEQLMMKFDVNVGDTINNILTISSVPFPHPYSTQIQINAFVTNKDSVELSNGNYYHWITLQGYEWNNQGVWESSNWNFNWMEKGLCNQYGSILNTFPDLFEEPNLNAYLNAQFCTSDLLVPNLLFPYHSCNNCVPIISSVEENKIVAYEIYPNPSTGQVTFEFDTYEPQREILITDLLGKQLDRFSATDTSMQYTFQNLGTGIYMVHLMDKGIIIQTQKIVIQN